MSTLIFFSFFPSLFRETHPYTCVLEYKTHLHEIRTNNRYSCRLNGVVCSLLRHVIAYGLGRHAAGLLIHNKLVEPVRIDVNWREGRNCSLDKI